MKEHLAVPPTSTLAFLQTPIEKTPNANAMNSLTSKDLDFFVSKKTNHKNAKRSSANNVDVFSATMKELGFDTLK